MPAIGNRCEDFGPMDKVYAILRLFRAFTFQLSVRLYIYYFNVFILEQCRKHLKTRIYLGPTEKRCNQQPKPSLQELTERHIFFLAI